MPCNCNRTVNNERCRSRIVIRADRVFDGARREETIVRTLPLSGYTPPAYTLPLTYISATYSGDATVIGVSATPLQQTNRSRVRVDYTVPVGVAYTDAAGIRGLATSSFNAAIDLLLTLPDAPYTVQVSTVFDSRIGNIADGAANVTGCLLTIVRVIFKQDIILCPDKCVCYPDATLTQDIVCSTVFDTVV